MIDLRRAEERGEFRGGSGHEARVISASDIERNDLADAPFLRGGGDAFHFLLAAGEDDLAGTVQVSNIDIAQLGNFLRLRRSGPEEGNHRPAGQVAGFLHEAAPLGDEGEAGFKGETPGRRMGGVFAEGKTGGGLEAEGLAGVIGNRGQEGEAVSVKSGLADARLGQDVRRSREAVFAEGPVEALVGAFVEGLSRGAVRNKISAHADFLRALSGKKDGAGKRGGHKVLGEPDIITAPANL